jgi:quercetin dioxygenase-like cupin family protein
VKTVNPVHTFAFHGTQHAVFHASVGEGLTRHEHNYPHLTVCHAGSCAVRKEGKQVVITKADAPIYLVQNQWHEIEALEDGTVFENIFMAGAN